MEAIRRALELYYGGIDQNERSALEKSIAMSSFLDEKGAMSIFISRDKEKRLNVFSEADLNNGDAFSGTAVCLSKVRSGILNAENLLVTPFSNSPTMSLYSLIHGVFSPLMKAKRLPVNEKLRGLISELDDGLYVEISSGIDSDLPGSTANIDLDIKYWTQKQNVKQVQRQKNFPAYPQQRMILLFDATSNHVAEILTRLLRPIAVMKDSFAKVKDAILWAQQSCDRWEEICSNLTQRFWPHCKPNAWTGPKYTSATVQALKLRLGEIYHIRTCLELYLQLLSREEQKEAQLENVLIIFDRAQLLDIGGTEWKELQMRYDKSIGRSEIVVASKLRRIFSALQSQPFQMLQEFEKFTELIKRDTIHKQLASETETLLGQLSSTLKAIKGEFKERQRLSKDAKVSFFSPYTEDILWARQMLSKVEETGRAIGLLNAAESKNAIASDLKESLRKYEVDLFNSWISDAEYKINETDDFKVRNGRLMNLDVADGSLVVNFGEALVTLIRDVRQLSSMGFAIPAKVLQAAENAQKYYRFGVVLKQVAHFYNTIHEQMLPCQHAMLLDAAKEFEGLIKNPKGSGPAGKEISWESHTDVEDYIRRLQECAGKLTSENRRLRKYHSQICETIVGLMSVDLVKPQTKLKWKEALSSIRSYIGSAQEANIKTSDTLSWRNHLDYQLYKSLEHQYRVSLENLNENLAEISVDLIFQQQKLQFRPPFENIRANFYREMKNIINIPSTFRGVGEIDIFKKMVDKNSQSLSVVYRKTDILFLNLLNVFDRFKDWVILGTVPLDSFVDEALSDVYDWEMNFKMLKVKGKEAEQIPSSIKIDCITICTAPVKATIDDHLQRLFDSLLNALRKAIGVHITAIDEFVVKATDTLSKRPQTLEEISEANMRHEELSAAKAKIMHHFESSDLKNRLLKSVAGNGVDTSKVQAKWSKLELLLESHELVIREQVDLLRGAIEGRKAALMSELEKFTSRWNQLKPNIDEVVDEKATLKAVAFIREKKVELQELIATAEQINKDCNHFSIQNVELTDLDDVREDVDKVEAMWVIFEEYSKCVFSFLAQDWISLRSKTHVFEEELGKWMEKIRARKVDSISVRLQSQITNYLDFCPYLKYLRGDTWMSEHWGELFRIIGMAKGVTLSNLTLGHFFELKESVRAQINAVKELNSRANGEVAIREALQELDMWGAGAIFALSDYQDAKGEGLKLIKEWKETMTQVGDNQSLLQSLKDSPYYKLFSDKAQIWEKRLAELDEVLRNLNNVQRRWVYLEPIFSRGSLPSEQGRFGRIDSDFRQILNGIAKDSRVVSTLSISGIRDTLVTLVDQLERCQKALNDFLEDKRAKFARFYFIGDDDLLEILGQAKNPNVIQTHLKKLFAGVHQVEFNEQMTSIIGMKSLEGEVVKLKTPIEISSEVERWLEEFTLEMRATLKHHLEKCLGDSDIFKFPSQVLGLSEYLHFTAKCESAITKGSLSNFSNELSTQLDKYTNFDTSKITDATERHVTEIKVKSLILDVIHFLDIVKQLQEAKVSSLNDWAWQRQLRFYIQKDRKDDYVCVIKMNNSNFEYSFEYQGNPQKLVHTQLTDKCYLTLTQAMSSGFGGNPFGPAGTGKTESVKALGVLFGRQVLVFNCDEGIDYKSMGRIFVGLVKCGAWGCFDEFNRLEEAVLSAVSQQIQVIQAALKAKAKTVELLKTLVEVNQNSGVFVTLNPAGKGYGGRQKLPDNLKQLFRSVAMTHPDNELIAGVILFAEGFKLGKELGAKVVSVFGLCKQLLSHQQHYDWGLRPLKSVLSLAGQLLHSEKAGGDVNTKREAVIIVKALRVNTLSKLTFSDGQRFNSLMKDIFPDVVTEDISYPDLSAAIADICKELNLERTDSQTEKIFQLHEACKQRMGVVLVGPSGSGKSTLWQILEKAWLRCGQKLRKHVTNPKAIDRQSLLGHMDIDTREWFDGILTFASRQAVKEPADTHSWIICDGDIDPEWIESLNSVLDDNRLLTMPNGERIQFGPNVNFIFETHNLKFASPATVSRMGMIYLSDETLDVRSLVKSWIGKQSSEARANLEEWIGELFFKSLDWVSQSGDVVIETTKAGLIMNGLSHLEGVKSRLQCIYALIRGLGANLYMENRLLFANEVLKWANETPPDSKRTLDFYINAGRLQCYDIGEPSNLDVKSMRESDRLPVVETVDIKRAMETILPWLKSGYPFMVAGPEGAGKHMLDLSNWIIGLTHYEYESEEELQLLEIVAHEAMRQFSDRLIPSDRPKFLAIMNTVLRSDWNATVDLSTVVYTSTASSSGVTKNGPKMFARTSLSAYKDLIMKEILVYERDFQDLGLCLFPEALTNISKVERVLAQPGGSLLLIGRPGVGRSSSSVIIGHLFGMKVMTPTITRNYTPKDFAANLKEVLSNAGILNEETMFILEDHQITNVSFLESVNSLLSGGEVPGLYAPEELDSLLSSIKDQHSELGFRGTLFEFFVSRIRKNLHVVIMLDSASKNLTLYCEANPALYTKCQLEWLESWLPESMESLVREVLSQNSDFSEIKELDAIIKLITSVHNSTVSRASTPKHFVSFIKTYEKIFSSQRDHHLNKVKYLAGGLKKLQDASVYVDALSVDAKKQGIQLAEKQKQADVALKQITDSILKASDQKKEMEALSIQLKEEEENLIVRKSSIEGELAEVEPIVKAAQAAVGEIKPESLTEIRSLRAPPPAVRDVLEGVLRLMGTLDMSWNSMRGFLGKRTIKDEIMNFNARNITKQVRDTVTDLLKTKRDSFEEANIKRTSTAAAPLAMWVKANVQYSAVLERIGPLEADLGRLTKTLDASRQRVAKLKEALALVDKNVSALRDDFGSKTRDAETLRSSLDKASGIIKSSQGLLEKLSGEGKRWEVQVKEIYDNLLLLPKNALLSAAFITYLSGTSEDIRLKYISEWRALSGLSQFDFRQVMSSESEQLVWKSQGLPSDALSNENAVAILNSVSTPLIIDPSAQAIAWLKQNLIERKPEIIKQHEESFIRSFELAIRFGKTLIIEDVSAIEPILYSVLKKDLHKQGPRYTVRLGDKMIDFNENFKVYLVASSPSFVTPSDASGLVNEINFTITRAGLAGQLLGITLKHEKPELEVEKVKLLKKEDALKMQLTALEESLLKELASSAGNILENTSLIESLNETKSKSASIVTGLKESQKLQISLDAEREKFAPMSQFGSNLFFVVSDLQKLNNMYQFSLSSFLRLFEEALRCEGSASKDGTDLRIKLLTSALEKLTFRYISRSLFNADRQMFALYLIHELHEHLFEAREWSLFTGQALAGDIDEKKVDIPIWMPSERRAHYGLLLMSLPNFCHAMNFGDTPPSLNFKRIFNEETLAEEPILFITTPGADPSQELRDFAAKEIGADNYREVTSNVIIDIIIENELRTNSLNPKFRLVMTSEAHSRFPPSLLQNCLKITSEAPPGLRRLVVSI
ncbi:Cytoplasmic dynein 2 heavy chain 1 [Irineochytrium annulatum]|nr:Cytoplasmic dynein 2 heavy chain 1 [Irineochytrium annulatum]